MKLKQRRVTDGLGRRVWHYYSLTEKLSGRSLLGSFTWDRFNLRCFVIDMFLRWVMRLNAGYRRRLGIEPVGKQSASAWAAHTARTQELEAKLWKIENDRELVEEMR